ncbi:S-layer homology domain-containing protein [Marinicrinis sediminis]|uniref:S-layer homology domain-containing protein n=1 Tax=Marinicrinis sediminis TaxID=1652465 RepID=A0ABW5RB72_9BACL
MREPSYPIDLSKKDSHKPKDIRGGERKVMKKSLSLVLAASLVASAFAGSASAASEMTAMEKFEALKAQGIFAGRANGDADLDAQMTRAEFARVGGLLKGLDVDAEPSTNSFTDVSADAWYYEEIEAANAAGFMQGYGNGKFLPSDNVKTEEMARVLVDILGLEVDADAEVTGKVSDWAKGYVAAAIKAGIIDSSDDYTQPALRSELVSSSYVVNEVQNPEQAVAITLAGAKKFEVSFTEAVDTANVKATVKKGDNTVALKSEWNEAKNVLTLSRSINLDAGEYTVTVSGVANVEDTTKTFTVAPERIDAVNLEDVAYKTTLPAGGVVDAEVAYKLVNQYGEDITSSINKSDLVATTSSGAIEVGDSSGKANGVLEISDLPEAKEEITVSIVDKVNGNSARKTVQVKDQKVVEDVTIQAPELKDGKTALEAGVNDYKLPYTAKDQFGNDIKVTDLSKLTFISSNSTAFTPDVTTNITLDADKNILIDFPSFEGPQEVKLTVIVNRSGESSSVTFTVNGTATAEVPTLVLPEGRFSGTDYKVQLQVKDQYGNDMKAEDIVTAYTNNKFTLSSGNTSKFTVAGVEKDGEKAVVRLLPVNISSERQTGSAVLTVTVNKSGKTASTTVNVVEAQKPTAFTLDASVTHAVYNADLTLKGKFTDQYGEEIKTSDNDVVFETSDATAYAAPNDTDVTTFADAGVTFTALKANSSSKITVKLKNASNQVIDSREVTLTTVKNDAALTYSVEEVGTIADEAAGIVSNEYAKKVVVMGTDASGNKVALKDPIVEVVPVDTSIVVAAVDGSDWKLAAQDTDENKETVVNVRIKTPTGNLLNKQVTVKVSKDAPKAVELKSKDDKTEIAINANASYSFADFFDTDNSLSFIIKDQFGVENYSDVVNNAAVFVTNKETNVLTKVTGTYNFEAGKEYKVTVVAGDKQMEVTVKVNPSV